VEDEIGDPVGGLGARLIRAEIDLDRHEQGDVARPRIGTKIAVGLRLPGQLGERGPDRGAGGLDLSIVLDPGVQAGFDRGGQRADSAVDARITRRPPATSRLQSSSGQLNIDDPTSSTVGPSAPPCTSTQLAAPLIMNMRSFPGTRLSFPVRHARTS
jgi:hypothetical protein